MTIEESDNPGGTFEFKNSTAVVLQVFRFFFASLECYPVILKILRNKLPANIAITNSSSLDLVGNKEAVISVNTVPSLSALQCPLYHCKTLRKEGCLVPERRFPSPSRSIRFCDFSFRPRDPKRFGCAEY